MNLRPRRPSPAMAIACLALVLSLGGTGYAAERLARNSVGTPQLKKNAVNSKKVKNRSLRAVDFARGELPTGNQGPQGPRGEQGASGQKGEPGRSALSPLQTGETVHGVIGAEERPSSATGFVGATESLPVPAPVALDNTHVSVDGIDEGVGNECTGSYATPTAAPGFLCIYVSITSNATGITGNVPGGEPTKYGFLLDWGTTTTGGSGVMGSWAYTAP